MATLDPVSEEIAVYDWQYLPQQPQPRPRHVIDAEKGPSWYYYYTPYVAYGALPAAAWFMYGEAPQYGSTINLYNSVQPIKSQIGSQAAAVPTAAPTSGAYTGIPSGCGPSGISGSPY